MMLSSGLNWVLVALLFAHLYSGEDRGVASDGLALNEHFSSSAWFAGPVGLFANVDGVVALENVTQVPVGISVGYDHARQAPMAWTIDPKAKPGLWGSLSPGNGTPLKIDERKWVFTGYQPGLYRICLAVGRAMEKRVLVLLPGEGYASHFQLSGDFFSDRRFENLRAFRLGTTGLMQECFLAKDARLQPGQPVPLEAGRQAAAGGYQDIALIRGPAPPPSPPVRPKPGNPLRAMLYARRAADGGLDILYGVMNDTQGLDPLSDPPERHVGAVVWVWQNASIQALATASVMDGEKLIASVDSTAAAALATLLPSRQPSPLYLGEVLTWHLSIPADRMQQLHRSHTYTVQASIPFRVALGGSKSPTDENVESGRLAISIPLSW